MPPNPEFPRVACTLAEDDHKARLAWMAELNEVALLRYRRQGGRIELVYRRSAAAGVREFVDREQQCCPFLDFTVHDGDDVLTVVIETPAEFAAAADSLFMPYTETIHQ